MAKPTMDMEVKLDRTSLKAIRDLTKALNRLSGVTRMTRRNTEPDPTPEGAVRLSEEDDL